MKRIMLLVTVTVVMAAMVAFSGSVGAQEPPGRAASVGGLGTALQQTPGDKAQGGYQKIEFQAERAQDEDTPGVEPGGGGFEP
jgi:hypothetical protein